jgi:hypothetical protein
VGNVETALFVLAGAVGSCCSSSGRTWRTLAKRCGHLAKARNDLDAYASAAGLSPRREA